MTAPHKAELVVVGLAAYWLVLVEAHHGLQHLLDPILKALAGG